MTYWHLGKKNSLIHILYNYQTYSFWPLKRLKLQDGLGRMPSSPGWKKTVACGWLWPLYIHLFAKTMASILRVICFSFHKFQFSILIVNVVLNRIPVIRLHSKSIFFTPGSIKKKKKAPKPWFKLFL